MTEGCETIAVFFSPRQSVCSVESRLVEEHTHILYKGREGG